MTDWPENKINPLDALKEASEIIMKNPGPQQSIGIIGSKNFKRFFPPCCQSCQWVTKEHIHCLSYINTKTGNIIPQRYDDLQGKHISCETNKTVEE